MTLYVIRHVVRLGIIKQLIALAPSHVSAFNDGFLWFLWVEDLHISTPFHDQFPKLTGHATPTQ